MLQQATTARSVSSRANTDQEQLHEQPRWAPPPPPTGQDRALTISLAPVLPQPPHTAHHTPTHAPDIVTIYYQYIFPPVQRLQQAPAGGSVSCTTQQQSNSLAAPLPQPPPTEPSQTIHQTTQQYTTTYIHTRTKYCDNPPPTHPPACTNTTNYACTNVCKCVWVCRASGSDACADAEARSTATIMKPCCCQGCTYIKYGHPLLVVALMHHFYNKLVVGIMIMTSKQIFLF